MHLMGVDAFTTILVTGAGPVGLGRSSTPASAAPGDRGRIGALARRRAQEMGAAAVLDPRDKQILKQIQD